jgi:single-strand DNA-binding protein
MPSLNKAIIMGHLGKDPVLRAMPDGKSVVNFSIAASESYKNKDGEKVDKTEWFNIVAFARLADICAEYLKKGALVYVEGKFQTRKYEKDGTERYITEVIIHEMKMLGGKSERNSADDDHQEPAKSKPKRPADQKDFMDEEVPF